jgi:hypothetical protein
MMHLTTLSHRTRSWVWAQYVIGQKQNILRYVEKGWFSRVEIAEETGPFGLIAPGCLGGSGWQMTL